MARRCRFFLLFSFIVSFRILGQSDDLLQLEENIRKSTISYLEEGKYDHARAFYKKKANEPSSSAIVKSRLAYLYFKGLGGPVNIMKAKVLLEAALEQVETESKMPLILSIGLVYVYSGTKGFVPGNYDKWLKYEKLTQENLKTQSSSNLIDLTAIQEFILYNDWYSCVNNDPYLQEQINFLITKFKFPPLIQVKAEALKVGRWTYEENKDSSYHYFEKLVNLNYQHGIIRYSEFLWEDEDYKRAFDLAIELARKKNYLATKTMAGYYMDPTGPYLDLVKARFWYMKAIEKGNYRANLDVMHAYYYEINNHDQFDKLDTLLELGIESIDNEIYGACEYMAWAIKIARGEYDDEAINYAKIGAENGDIDALLIYSYATKDYGSRQRSELNSLFREISERQPNPRLFNGWARLVNKQIYYDDFEFHPSLYRTPLSYYEHAIRCRIGNENAQKKYDDLYDWLRKEDYLKYVR